MFTIAIVGRPNVGKSTLFNRLVGRRKALVSPHPGLTRDRRTGRGRLGDLLVTVVDTAGLEAGGGTLEESMVRQTRMAIQEADVCLFVVDARTGITALDHHFAQMLRKLGKPVLVAANKAEGGGAHGVAEAWELGLGPPLALSAAHGQGLAALEDAVRACRDALAAASAPVAHDAGSAAPEDPALRLAIIGRPNVGKSTLVNRLLGAERVLTGPRAGVTRDAVAVDWSWQGQAVRLHDTAGQRRRSRVSAAPEALAAADARRAVRFADAVVLLTDATAPFEKQDAHLAAMAVDEGRALVLAANKMDLLDPHGSRLDDLRAEAAHWLPQVPGLGVVLLSAKTGRGADTLMPRVMAAVHPWSARVSTGPLNRWLAAATAHHPPPGVAGRRPRLRYITQTATRPPTFTLFASRSDIPDAYQRYLLNALRKTFNLPGTPLRLALAE